MALPALFSTTVPSDVDVVPSRKFTVPVGVPAPGATTVTVAVSVTDCPKLAGLGDAVNAVVVPARFTT